MTFRQVLVVCSLLQSFALPSPAPGGVSPDSVTAPRRSDLRAFLNEEVEFDRYIFPPGAFPRARWKNADRVISAIGPVSLEVEYYDHDFVPVTRAAVPGRYAGVVRGTTQGGFQVVRYVTLYCSRARFDDYAPDVPVTLQPLRIYGIPAPAWESYRKNLRRFSFGGLLLFPEHDPDAAIFLAGLGELTPGASEAPTPRLVDRLWWIRFKRRHDGRAHPEVSFSPRKLDRPAPVLAPGGTPRAGGLPVADVRELRGICSAWIDSSGIPMTALIVRRGKILFHESFGKTREGSVMTPATPTWMASITKCLTGVLVMQFVDRGLLDLDAPIDRYLPELPAPCPLTLRLLMTHTAGLSWTGEWASDWNPSMENQIAQALPVLTPAREFRYHRAGYALAAKILERISGETVPRLFDRLLFAPLGMHASVADNTYGGLYAPALDLAKYGEMLRNRGRYGSYEILSEKAWRALLPAPLPLAGAPSDQRWGIGTSPYARDGLSAEAFGHAAASGAVFRVDPVRELVVVIGCDETGQDENKHRRFVSAFVRALTAALDRSAGHE
jgi:CubicO group peptidase (beta-lactamase class C family)